MSVNLWKSFMLQKIPSLDGYEMKEKGINVSYCGELNASRLSFV